MPPESLMHGMDFGISSSRNNSHTLPLSTLPMASTTGNEYPLASVWPLRFFGTDCVKPQMGRSSD